LSIDREPSRLLHGRRVDMVTPKCLADAEEGLTRLIGRSPSRRGSRKW
jgi:hypothetical protein